MTIVNIINEDGLLDINISGHSGYDDIGSDIVCAGISSITYALANTLERLNADVEISSGYCHIQARYDEDMDDYIQGIVDVAVYGYLALAQQYPDYIDYNP